MPGCKIIIERVGGIVKVRIEESIATLNVTALMLELRAATSAARAAGPLRVLWDNRAGIPLPAEISVATRAILVGTSNEEERVAILVSDSSAKVKARPQLVGASALFASESAALTWLAVGLSAAA